MNAGFERVVDINAGQDTAQDPMDNTVARRRLENAVRCTAEDKIKKLRRLCDRS